MHRSACLRVWFVVATVLFIAVAQWAVSGHAATLYWTGNVSTNWFDVDGANTNWRNALDEQVVPTAGDDLVFTSEGAYGGNLTLGGATITLNSITVGDPNNRSIGGPSDFGVEMRVLATDGTIRLGAGGLDVEFPDGVTVYAEGNTRNYRFNTDFEFLTDSQIRGYVNIDAHWKLRQVFFGGEISGGTAADPITLEISTSDGSQGTTKAFFFEESMPNVYGTLRINGVSTYAGSSDIWGDPSTKVELSIGGIRNAYVWKTCAGDLVTPNDIAFSDSRTVLLFNNGSNTTWDFSGDITGGVSTQRFDLLGSSNSIFEFSGEQQTFSNFVGLRTGATIVISGAGPNGIAWPNVNYIQLNSSALSGGVSGLLLRGDYELNQNIEIRNVNTTVPVYVGQSNDGTTPFDATFSGAIQVTESDFQVLRLTADAGGSVAFDGRISVTGGAYGFDKVGAGTVVINQRVSQASAGTLPIGTVYVQEGTLLVNSQAVDNDAFHVSEIIVKEGATLGGTGQIVGDVSLSGSSAATLAPGGSIGTLSVDGDVVFGSFGGLLVEVGSGESDRLVATGLLDLSSDSDWLEFQTVGSLGGIYVIAEYGSLAGQFDTVVGLPEDYWLDYAYLGQNQIALVPEPSAFALLAMGLAIALLRRWRR